MTTARRRCFGLPLKGLYKEPAVAGLVLIDPSASVGMTESRRERHERARKRPVIPSEVEESVKENPAKRLNYDHAPGKMIVRGKVKNGEVVDLIAIKLCR